MASGHEDLPNQDTPPSSGDEKDPGKPKKVFRLVNKVRHKRLCIKCHTEVRDIISHMRWCTARPYFCDFCNKKCVNEGVLRLHMQVCLSNPAKDKKRV